MPGSSLGRERFRRPAKKPNSIIERHASVAGMVRADERAHRIIEASMYAASAWTAAGGLRRERSLRPAVERQPS